MTTPIQNTNLDDHSLESIPAINSYADIVAISEQLKDLNIQQRNAMKEVLVFDMINGRVHYPEFLTNYGYNCYLLRLRQALESGDVKDFVRSILDYQNEKMVKDQVLRPVRGGGFEKTPLEPHEVAQRLLTVFVLYYVRALHLIETKKQGGYKTLTVENVCGTEDSPYNPYSSC